MGTLNLKDVNKAFGPVEVIKGVNLEINDGEFVVFVGPSGCGKSTLLRMIAGLETETAGAIEIGGTNVTGMEPVDRGIAMVFQSYALYPHMSVFDNIAFPLRTAKQPKDQIKHRVEKAAQVLHLTDRLDHKPAQLSGGQRQRVAIGRAIVRDPKVFLFDEPLSNLDASLRGEMRVELAELHRQLKTTMGYVTHDQVEAMTMADRIVVLNGGHVEQFGTPMELYHHPETRFVAGFMGQPVMNFVAAEVVSGDAAGLVAKGAEGTTFHAHVNGTRATAGQSVEIGLRPEDLQVESADSSLSISLRVVERLGGVTNVYGNLSDGTPICGSLDGTVDFAPGDTVELYYFKENLHAFDAGGAAFSRVKTSLN